MCALLYYTKVNSFVLVIRKNVTTRIVTTLNDTHSRAISFYTCLSCLMSVTVYYHSKRYMSYLFVSVFF